MIELLVKRLSVNAKIPTKKREEDEGYDLYSNETILLPENKITMVHTGIAAYATDVVIDYSKPKPQYAFNNKYWLQIEGRSGLASKGISPVGGIVDSGYRGELAVLLLNLSGSHYTVNAGERIAQIVIRHRMHAVITEVEELPEGNRGDRGFGSSGK